MIKLIFLLTFISCTQLPKGTRLRNIPVADEAEARTVVQNQVNFLTQLFTQTKDPYYNVDKWPPGCIESNEIGKLEENNEYIRSVSMLYLKNNEPGNCPHTERTALFWVIYLHCKKSHTVQEMKLYYEVDHNFKDKKLCP